MTTLETRPEIVEIPATEPGATDTFVERLFGSVLAALDLQAVYLGDRLGYYRALAEGALTSTELAARTGTAERYVREWLEQQAVTGILVTDDRVADALARRYTLPAPYVAPLTDALDLSHFAPFVRFVVGSLKQTELMVEAFRTGGGVSWAQHGAGPPRGPGRLRTGRCSSARWARSTCRRSRTWTARYAPAGGWPTWGAGWAGRRSASRWPIRTPRWTATTSTVRRSRRRGATPARRGSTTACGSTPWTPRPRCRRWTARATTPCSPSSASTTCPTRSGVLAAMRRLAGDGGTVVVMDERVAETFTAPGDDVERLMYGYSLVCCLADGMAHQPSAGTGTVMRPSTLRRYAVEAGFADVEILDIDNDFFRFYRLR